MEIWTMKKKEKKEMKEFWFGFGGLEFKKKKFWGFFAKGSLNFKVRVGVGISVPVARSWV